MYSDLMGKDKRCVIFPVLKKKMKRMQEKIKKMEINATFLNEKYSLYIEMHFKRGDKMERFMELYETVYKDLYYLAYYYLGNQQDAEDAVSEAVLNAYENFASLRKVEAFRSWIIKILVNQCKYQQRKSGSQKTSEMLIEPSYHPKLEDSVITGELLRGLSQEERVIVALSVFGGYKGEEIAKLMDLRHSTVRSKYRRALKKLEQRILAEEVQYGK